MRIAVVYASVTGNTEELAEMIQQQFTASSIHVDLFSVKHFPLNCITDYDGIVIGTYTWANGTIPGEMLALYEQIESADTQQLTTGVFGTGDSFFPYFCGAVEEFRDMLYVHTNLAVTMKVELRPQSQDWSKCRKFVDCILEQLEHELQPIG
ncbi:flavodoxin [Virgibacillus dakarensis]|uniref:Flavodoxin-1 n=1 Tax=Lentibacillus populi TaxID=1827502 RepID=A0A9W5X4G1_9BACI|nr:flavodoxin domain-containing protein [Virgibacillus dakarensis]MTW87738.1 flavodoxin [Virgibacillus dakarensis]GGB35277.1 putative flavodoxin-1 [Lentibacillus populi]